MIYFPIVRNWYRIKPHLENKDVQDVLVRDFNKYTFGRWKQEFKHGMVPAKFERCDWALDRKGRPPEYFNYVKHGACHWLVNFNLKLVMLVEPNRKWRILTSDNHSTVWDGKEMLFDFNFTALKIDPNEAFSLANKRQLKIGTEKKVYLLQEELNPMVYGN